MSETQQVLDDADRHSPIRKATATRQSASGPGDRIASLGDIAGFLREDCRPLGNSLQLEMVVAQYELRLRHGLGAGVVAELERHGDPLSRAILIGLEDLSASEADRGLAADAVVRLAEAGVGLSARFADVAGARPLGAWRASEGGRPGEYVLFAEFEHPLGTRHSLALFVDPRRGGVAKHIGLLSPMGEIGLSGPFHPDAMDRVEIAATGVLLRELLERSFGGPTLTGTDDYRVLVAAARARGMESA